MRAIALQRRSGLLAVIMIFLLLFSAAAKAQELDRAVMQAVFPGAESFTPFESEPPIAEARAGDQLLGYLFRTRQIVASVGYSGKPLDVLVGLDLEGRITGARILEHHEPILVIGVSDQDLHNFVEAHRGLDIRDPIRITRHPGDDPAALEAVSGATVSSAVIDRAILRAARVVAQTTGIIGEGGRRLAVGRFEPASWPELLEQGALRSLTLSVGEVEAALQEKAARLYPEGARPAEPDSRFIELWAALATPAAIGRNLLGARDYDEALAAGPDGSNLIFIGARGLYSFKGTDFVRSGRFERIQLVQGERQIPLTREGYTRPEELEIDGAPSLRESALFLLPPDSGFDPLAPWRLELLVEGEAHDDAATPVFTGFPLNYEIPDRYVIETETQKLPEEVPLWQERWQDRSVEIGILSAALILLTAIFIFQDGVMRRWKLYIWLRLGFLSFTLLWLGWYAAAQLSVLNVLTFGEALRTKFRWDFFLLEPLLFVLWSYVGVALLFLGRGVFCGWLCPFGAFQELLARLAQRLGVPQIVPPFALHERLWPLKYVVFIVLFAVSLGAVGQALALAEVEPFKTAIILHFRRPWPYVVYALALLSLGLFIERPFCRYLCPLGGALAIPARLRMFEWLKRRPQCGTECNICAQQCPVQAIHKNGQINPNECIYCLKCQGIMYDEHTCPPLVRRRKRREERETRRSQREADAAVQGPAP